MGRRLANNAPAMRLSQVRVRRYPATWHPTLLPALAAWVLAALAPSVAASASVGLLLDDRAPAADAVSGAPWVRVALDWAGIEPVPGELQWAAAESRVRGLEDAGYRVAVCLALRHPTHAPGAVEAWTAAVRATVVRLAPDAFQVGCRWDPSWDPEEYAYLLKQSALFVRVAARDIGRDVLVVQAAVPAADAATRERLWNADVAPYVDAVPVFVSAGADPAPVVATLTRETTAHPPAPRVWTLHPADPADPWSAPASAIRALAAGASAAFYESWGDGVAAARWASGAQEVIAAYLPAPPGDIELGPAPGSTADGEILGRFFETESLTSLVFYRVRGSGGDARLHLVVRGAVTDAAVLDPATGDSRRLPTTGVAGDPTARAIVLRATSAPAAARFRVATPGLDRKEQLEVATTRSLTADEIIARHQEVRAAQDEHLERWTAQGRIDLHFKIAQGGNTIDLSIDSTYFWRRGGQLEWEQTDYYINGNRVRWKNIPELPLIQPEKVVTLPLDLHLDKTYAYRIVGEDRVGDRVAWVLSFEPSVPDVTSSLYRGRIWIDKDEFVRLKVSVMQTNMDPPVLSNEETDSYRPQIDAGGRRYWLLADADGQQVWTAAGRNFVVQREVTFRDFEINPPAEQFDERVARAYSSSHQMLRDTDDGFRYLERVEGGERRVKETVDSNQLFAAVGAFRDSSTDGVTPLAGVNYFDYDVGGRNVQLNALFAGVLAFVTVSKPDMFDRRIDGTIDVTASALAFDDKVFHGDDEIDQERVDARTQSVALRLGLPVGQFFKASLVGSFAHRDYSRNEDGDDAVAGFNAANPGTTLDFEVPRDHLQSTASVEAEYNRRGYSVGARYGWSSRSSWGRWGLRRVAPGEEDASVEIVNGVAVPVAPPELEDRFTRWGVSAAKQWFLPKFQKLRGEAVYLDGDRLDRFSRYQFDLFGTERLSGFSGSGVRFDSGVIGRAGYSFNLFEAIRFDATVESARVERDEPGARSESHTGLGLGGSFVGPWKTVFNISYGYALASDVRDLEREQEFFLLVLKLF